MKKFPAMLKYILVITAVYALSLLSLWATGLFHMDKDASQILVGIGTGLVAWLLTYGFTAWLDQERQNRREETLNALENHLKQSFPPHKDETTQILNVVQGKYLSLINMKRRLLGTQFFSDRFRGACVVKISGIANRQLLNDLNTMKDNHPLVESLQKSEIAVEILLAHPRSNFVKIRDKTEGRRKSDRSPCSEGIKTALGPLGDLGKQYENAKLRDGNRLVIRLSPAPLGSTLTYVKKATPRGEEILLMGPLFHHDLGGEMPIYQVPREANSHGEGLFEGCLKNFETLWDDSSRFTVFVWDSGGARCYLDVMSSSCEPDDVWPSP